VSWCAAAITASFYHSAIFALRREWNTMKSGFAEKIMKFFRPVVFASVALIALLGCAQKKPVVARDSKLELKQAENYFKHLDVEVLPEIPDRLFADVSNSTAGQPEKWKEFKKVKPNVDPIGDKYISRARAWIKGKDVLAASFNFDSPGKNWNRSARYYF
jgi:hypothetical protein